MVVCKICEKDIDEDKLGPHSAKCKEVTELREELLQIQSKMEIYSENSQRIKRSLETQVTKLKNLQRKKMEAKLEPPSLGMAITRSKTQPLGDMIKALNEEDKGNEETTKTGSKKDPNVPRKSIGHITQSEELMNREEYKKFSHETKRSILALNKVSGIADKINNWIGDTASAIEVDFNIKNELIAIYDEIVDQKVSEFLQAFISDLTNYVDIQTQYSKKKNELLTFDSSEEEAKRLPGLNKFWAQRSSSYRVPNFKSKNFLTRKKKSPEEQNDSNSTISESEEAVPQLCETETALADHFKKNMPLRNRILLKNQCPFQSQPSNDTPDEQGQSDGENMESVYIPVRHALKKKSSRLIRADTMRITALNNLSEDQGQPSIRIIYREDDSSDKDQNYEPKKILSPKSSQPSDFLKSRQKTKLSSFNLLQSLQTEESPNPKVFPSLNLNHNSNEDHDDFEDNSPGPSWTGKSAGWESPYIKGYYSDAFSKSKSARLLSLGDSSKIQIDEFEFVKFLGKGAYGTVWLVRKKATHDLYAMKIVDWADRFTQNRISALKAERDIYEILQGDFVVKAVWTFHFQNYICFVTEYMIGGDFNKILEDVGRLEEDQARFYFAELVVAIEALHNLGIVHRDLKPDNFLMDAKGHLRLTDFGLSEGGLNKLKKNSTPEQKGKHLITQNLFPGWFNVSPTIAFNEAEKKHLDFTRQTQIEFREKKKEENIFKFLNDKDQYTIMYEKKPTITKKSIDRDSGEKKLAKVGTPDYMAPEVIDSDTDKIKLQNYNEKCMDWWSMGAILYQFLVGIPPFCDETLENVFENVRNRRIDWPPIGEGEDCISPQAADLIEKLLTSDPSKRLGVNGAQEVKEHAFFKDLDWGRLHENDGPIVPWVQTMDEINTPCSQGQDDNKEKLPFENLSLKKSVNSTPTTFDLGGFHLTRLDVLDKLNQEQYQEFQKKKSENQE